MTQGKGIAIVGAGKLGTYHAQALTRIAPDEPVWVVDIDAERAQRLADHVNARFTARLDEALEHSAGAVIATPTECHSEIAQTALAAGCHCLIEKPITTTVAEAEALLRSAQAQRRQVQVGHSERFNPIFRRMRAEIGLPAFVEAERLAPFDPRSLDIDVVRDLMVHDLDLLLAILPLEPVAIDAVGVAVLTPREDIANAHLRFSGGTVANLTASRVSQEKVRKIRFFGPAGYLSLDLLRRSARRVIVRAAARDVVGPPFEIHAETIQAEPGDALTEQMRDFLAVVRDGRSPEVDGAAGLRVLRIAERISAGVTESLQRFAASLPTGARAAARSATFGCAPDPR